VQFFQKNLEKIKQEKNFSNSSIPCARASSWPSFSQPFSLPVSFSSPFLPRTG
jgi:hypothetical protein